MTICPEQQGNVKEEGETHYDDSEGDRRLPTDNRSTIITRRSILSGYLNKYGQNVQMWKRRYFVLKPATYLYYFLSEEDTQPRGCIDMDVFSTVRHVEKKEDGRVVFEISTGGGNNPEDINFMLEAKDDKEASGWMENLISAKFTTLSMERDVLKEQEKRFLRELESLETQVHQLQSYADQRHHVEHALCQERREKHQLCSSLEDLEHMVTMALQHIVPISLDGRQDENSRKEEEEKEQQKQQQHSFPAASSSSSPEGQEGMMMVEQEDQEEDVFGAEQSDVESSSVDQEERNKGLDCMRHIALAVRQLESALIETSRERDDLRSKILTRTEQLAAREKELTELRQEMEVVSQGSRKAVRLLTSRNKHIEGHHQAMVCETAQLQQLVCHLQGENRKLKQHKKLLVQELVNRQRRSSAPFHNNKEVSADLVDKEHQVQEERNKTIRDDDTASSYGTEADGFAEIGRSFANEGYALSSLPTAVDSNQANESNRERKGGGDDSFTLGRLVDLVNNAHPKIEKLWLIASDSFSRSISQSSLLRLDDGGQGRAAGERPEQQEEETYSEHSIEDERDHLRSAYDHSQKDHSSRQIEYEVEFTTRKIGLRFRNVMDKMIVATYEGPELEMLEEEAEGSSIGRWVLPRVTGSTLLGMNGRSIEHLDFQEVTRLLAKAARPIRLRFRERMLAEDFFPALALEEGQEVSDTVDDEDDHQEEEVGKDQQREKDGWQEVVVISEEESQPTLSHLPPIYN